MRRALTLLSASSTLFACGSTECEPEGGADAALGDGGGGGTESVAGAGGTSGAARRAQSWTFAFLQVGGQSEPLGC